MSTGKAVMDVLKTIGKWVAKNPNLVIDTADKVIKLKPEDKLNQLGEAVLNLDKKIDTEMDSIRKQLHTMKISLYVMGALLGMAIITIILLAVL